MSFSSCLEISEESNLKLLQRIEDIKDKTATGKLNDNLTDIISYVERLGFWMKYRETSFILKYLPNIGKVLSNLSENCEYFSNGDLAQAVLSCIICLSKIPDSLKHATSDTEKKAITWALEQFQVIASPCISEGEDNFSDLFGFSLQDVVKAQIEEISSLVTNGNKWECRTKNGTGNAVFPFVQSRSKILRTISKQLIPFLKVDECRILIETLLLAQDSCPSYWNPEASKMENPLSKDFMDAITNDRGLLKSLSYGSTVCLWISYQPSFESEILRLVELVVKRPFNDDISLFNFVNSHKKLVLACAENQHLKHFAFDILKEFLKRVGGEPCLLSLVNGFHIAIQRIQLKDVSLELWQPTVKCLDWLPLEPFDLSLQERQSCILQIAAELKNHRTLDSTRLLRSDIWFELLQSRQWINDCLCLVFKGATNCLESCLEVLCWFYLPVHDDDTLATYQNISTNLRCLQCKNLVQMSDITYLIDKCKIEQTGSMLLLRDLMLVFLVFASGSHHILRETFAKVTEDLSYECKLDLWLRILERTLIGNGRSYILEKFSIEKKSTFGIFLSCLAERTYKQRFLCDEQQINDANSSEKDMLKELQQRVQKISSVLKQL